MKLAILLLFLILGSVSCSTNETEEFVTIEEGAVVTKIRILSAKDIEGIPEKDHFAYLEKHFGEGYRSTMPVGIYPKRRKDFDFSKESEESIMFNGYWIFPHADKDEILCVVSLQERVNVDEDEGNNNTHKMMIDWPLMYKGMSHEEFERLMKKQK